MTDFFCKKCGKPFVIVDLVYILFENGEHFDLCKECQEAIFLNWKG